MTAALLLSVGALSFRTVGPLSWVIAVCGGAVALAFPATVDVEIRERSAWVLATAAGIVAAVVVRLLAPAPLSATRWGIVAAVVTGVAEEALFRRGLYGLLERWGAAAAVVGSAAAFGLVHVPVYGWRVLALDMCAGLVFGWQRWLTGHWSSPAVTHALANVLAHV